MKDNVGIILIIAIIIIIIVTKGSIFKHNGLHPLVTENTSSSGENIYSSGSNYDQAPLDYKDRVWISSISDRETFDERVYIDTNLDTNEIVNITGWKLRSTVTGNEFVIGGAAIIPHVGVRDQTPIIISRGARIIISDYTSPINTSFRLNKCTGFFSEGRNFEPALHNKCPAIIDDTTSNVPNLTDECLDYIDTLPRCEVPKERDFWETLGASCKNYLLRNVNYESCVTAHKNDSDFFETEWRIYPAQPKILWRDRHEKIQLIDRYGRVVDTVEYNQ